MTSTQTEHFSIPLPKLAHDWAKTFASEQKNVQKGKQVYLNTLAVYATHIYLKILLIDSDLAASDSWNVGQNLLSDVADLVIPGVGKIECCPVLPNQTSFTIHADTVAARIGYVAVRIKDSLIEAELLGFIPGFESINVPKSVEIANLQPIEDVIDHISLIREAVEFLESEDPVATAVQALLADKSINDYAAKLDKIFRQTPANQQDLAIRESFEEVDSERELVGRVRDFFATGGENLSEEQAEDALMELAKKLLAKLKEIWGE